MIYKRDFVYANGVDLEFIEINEGVFICVLDMEKMHAIRTYQPPSMQKPITTLELSTRAKNCLVAEGIETIGQLINELKKSRHYLGKIHNCGKITEKEIKKCLKKSGFTWGEHDLRTL